MRPSVLLCVVWLLPLAALAQSRGVALYERGEYAQARRALESELRGSKLAERDRATARLYLAASLYELDDMDATRAQLEELARSYPDQTVDPALFPPEFVVLAAEARKRVLPERTPPPPEPKPRLEMPPPPVVKAHEAPEEPEELVSQRRARLLPEVFGFMDPIGKSVGVGGGLTYSGGTLEVGARALLGDQVGVGVQVGLVLGGDASRPHVALRATAIPGLSAYGGGPVVGVRIAMGPRFTALVDVGAEYFSVSDHENYRTLALTASAGFGFDLLSP
ncbi:hypothetical protein JY651_33825 [Pyxidicoccus parkwayensis]|uniref:Tetratricopeptide repeat protein n=1 Tax=Pyxidicoccus parkwayensis TaxID=2813578 RepID=A0ABX7NP65_9BACT|nr:tetratricopeptide repeat protein [Pyxidicoccus parkwaysis]QSQ20218.1 hypothetical protein JY651_33825 [Pyxidicoccus parkwaysis]